MLNPFIGLINELSWLVVCPYGSLRMEKSMAQMLRSDTGWEDSCGGSGTFLWLVATLDVTARNKRDLAKLSSIWRILLVLQNHGITEVRKNLQEPILCLIPPCHPHSATSRCSWDMSRGGKSRVAPAQDSQNMKPQPRVTKWAPVLWHSSSIPNLFLHCFAFTCFYFYIVNQVLVSLVHGWGKEKLCHFFR